MALIDSYSTNKHKYTKTNTTRLWWDRCERKVPNPIISIACAHTYSTMYDLNFSSSSKFASKRRSWRLLKLWQAIDCWHVAIGCGSSASNELQTYFMKYQPNDGIVDAFLSVRLISMKNRQFSSFQTAQILLFISENSKLFALKMEITWIWLNLCFQLNESRANKCWNTKNNGNQNSLFFL